MDRCVRNKLIVLLCLILVASFAFGQGIVTGSISGVVQDQQKAVLVGAKVTAKHLATNRDFTTVTTEAGLFSLRSLPIGKYNVMIEAQGFQKLEVRDVEVAVAKDSTLGAQTMTLGKSSEVVNVEGSAPLVDTTTAQVTAAFEAQKINNAPITNGFDALALFVPGVVSAGSVGSGNSNGALISANGQSARSNNFQIDGQANNDSSVTGPSIFMGNQDVIAEFQVTTQFDAAYGRNTGAVVNYVTKSGTNNFHGSAFEYNWNNSLFGLASEEKTPLNGYCLPYKYTDGTKRSTKWPTAAEIAAGTNDCNIPVASKDIDNRFGGTLGGPILKDKAWFFGSYMEERERWAGGLSTGGDTPTPAGLETLKAMAPNSVGLAALESIGPFGVKIGNPQVVPGSTYTVPVTFGGVTRDVELGSISRNVPGYYDDREILGRVDYQFSSKDRLFGRYLYQKANTVGSYAGLGFANGSWADVPAIDQQIGLDWTRNWSTSLVNQVRTSYSRINFGWMNGSDPGCTITDMSKCHTQITMLAPLMSFGTYSSYPQGRIINTYQVQDNASYVHGRHTLKFGGEFDRQRAPGTFLPNYNGNFSFDSLDSLLANSSYSTSVVDGEQKARFKENDYAFYFQDDWRVKDNLTLQLGVRWEMYGMAINALHDMTVARQQSTHPFWDPSLPLSRTTVPYVNNDKNNYSPIVGFAWNPKGKIPLFGEDKTTIRGGFRVAYDVPYQNIFLNVYGGAPVVNSQAWTSGAIPGLPTGISTFTGADVRPYLIALAPSGAGIDPGYRSQTTVAKNFHNPYSQQWNLGVQRMIGSKMAAEARYVGSHTVGIYQSYNGNPAVGYQLSQASAAGLSNFANYIPQGFTACSDPTMPGYWSSSSAAHTYRGYADCNRELVFERGNTASARYDGLQTRFDISNWHNLTFNFGYTYSRNLDNSSEVFNHTGAGQLAFNPNPYSNTGKDWGTGSIDFPHVASVMMTYNLPFQKSQKGILGHLLGGYQVNTTYRYASGEPWTPYQRKQSQLCDPANDLSSTSDSCRPILLNAGMPLNSIGVLSYSTSAHTYTLKDYYTGTTILSGVSNPSSGFAQFHYLLNNPAAVNYFGAAPWDLGDFRNTLRGDTINTANLGIYKNTKITERLNSQFQMTILNVLNRDFRGVPVAAMGSNSLVYDPMTGGSIPSGKQFFGNTYYNNSGTGQSYSMQNGLGRRAIQFAMRLTF